MRPLYRLPCLAAVLALVGLSPVAVRAQSSRPASPGVQASFDALRAAAARDGSVPVIVTLDAGAASRGTAQQRAAAQAAQAGVVGRLAAPAEVVAFRFIPALALRVGAADLERLQEDRRVVSVEEDRGVPPAAIAAPERLDDTTVLVGATAAWAAGFDGAGTEIAILDTGIDTSHPFLAGRIAGEACFSTPSGGYTSLCPNGQATQIGAGAGVLCDQNLGGCRHGTAVAGVAAGLNPGGPGPVAGVAPGAGILSIQVYSATDCGGSPCIVSRVSDHLRALEYVYDLAAGGRPIAAANLSLGGGRYTATCDALAFQAAAVALREVGVATVVASGNGGDPAATTYPGCASAAVTVGATTNADAVWSGSNVAPWLDLFAPGVNVRDAGSGRRVRREHRHVVRGAARRRGLRHPSRAVSRAPRSPTCWPGSRRPASRSPRLPARFRGSRSTRR